MFNSRHVYQLIDDLDFWQDTLESWQKAIPYGDDSIIARATARAEEMIEFFLHEIEQAIRLHRLMTKNAKVPPIPNFDWATDLDDIEF